MKKALYSTALLAVLLFGCEQRAHQRVKRVGSFEGLGVKPPDTLFKKFNKPAPIIIHRLKDGRDTEIDSTHL
jgi:hypothetical protein